MTNAGYPDDDGSRTASGQHDLGRQRASMCDVEADFMAQRVGSVADVQAGTLLNARTDSAGDQRVPYRGLVDGRASAGTAAYPPKPEDPNSRD